jgi:CRP-like cAMP-binding protein
MKGTQVLGIQPEPLAACRHCHLFPASCWNALETVDHGLLDTYRVESRLAAGQVLFEERAPCHGLHCIEGGLLALRKSDEHGNGVILRLAHPGETLGFPAFFGRMGYSASAEALRDSRICFFPGRLVQDILARNPGLRDEFCRLLAQELVQYGDARLRVATRTLEWRLQDLLLQLLPGCGEVDGSGNAAWLELPLSRRDLAAMLGVRPETVARAARQLGEMGLARFDSRRVVIPDLRRLRREVR